MDYVHINNEAMQVKDYIDQVTLQVYHEQHATKFL